MDGIPGVGKLVIRHLVDRGDQQSVLLYRPHVQDTTFYRELLMIRNGKVEERFGGRAYDVLWERSRNGSSPLNVTWREATDDDLLLMRTMWGDSRAHLDWLVRLREREGRLGEGELERLEQVFGIRKQQFA